MCVDFNVAIRRAVCPESGVSTSFFVRHFSQPEGRRRCFCSAPVSGKEGVDVVAELCENVIVVERFAAIAGRWYCVSDQLVLLVMLYRSLRRHLILC